MTQIVYVSDSMKKAIDFINDLVADLQTSGIENIKHNRQHNFIAVGDIEVRGISVFGNSSCIKINCAKYFIDGIDMRNYKDADNKRIDHLVWGAKEAIMHFSINAKQISGKEELIKILTGG